MSYKTNNIEFSNEILEDYLDKLINKIFAVLAIFEDCEKNNDFENFEVYLDRVIIEVSGGFYIIGSSDFISLLNILSGIKNDKYINHKKIKSLVFHCISLVKKMKNTYIGDSL